jgi:hypothetical protein
LGIVGGEQGTDYAVPCHTEMQTRRGIWNLENVDTKSLIDAKSWKVPSSGRRCASLPAPARQPIRWSSTNQRQRLAVAGRCAVRTARSVRASPAPCACGEDDNRSAFRGQPRMLFPVMTAGSASQSAGFCQTPALIRLLRDSLIQESQTNLPRPATLGGTGGADRN